MQEWADETLDPAAGIVAEWSNLPPYNDEPRIWHLSAALSVEGRLGEDGDNAAVAGGSSVTLERAKAKLAGESVERFGLAAGPESTPELKSYRQLLDEGEMALDPAELVCGDGTPVDARRDDEVSWTTAKELKPGTSWLDAVPGRSVFVPEQLVAVPHRFAGDEAIWRSPVSTGGAAHRSLDWAIRAAIAEVVERDAFQTAWLLQVPLPCVRFDSTLGATAGWLANQCRRYRLTLDVRLLPSAMKELNVVCAVIRDSTGVGPPSTVAAKASPSVADAAVGAVEECMQVRHWMRRILDTQGPKTASGPLDRLLDRARHWLTDEPNRTLDNWLSQTADFSEWPINEEAWSIYYVDLTPRITAAARMLGWHVVKVIAPSFQPLNLTDSTADLSWKRIAAVAAQAGMPERLCQIPHPFL